MHGFFEQLPERPAMEKNPLWGIVPKWARRSFPINETVLECFKSHKVYLKRPNQHNPQIFPLTPCVRLVVEHNFPKGYKYSNEAGVSMPVLKQSRTLFAKPTSRLIFLDVCSKVFQSMEAEEGRLLLIEPTPFFARNIEFKKISMDPPPPFYSWLCSEFKICQNSLLLQHPVVN